MDSSSDHSGEKHQHSVTKDEFSAADEAAGVKHVRFTPEQTKKLMWKIDIKVRGTLPYSTVALSSFVSSQLVPFLR